MSLFILFTKHSISQTTIKFPKRIYRKFLKLCNETQKNLIKLSKSFKFETWIKLVLMSLLRSCMNLRKISLKEWTNHQKHPIFKKNSKKIKLLSLKMKWLKTSLFVNTRNLQKLDRLRLKTMKVRQAKTSSFQYPKTFKNHSCLLYNELRAKNRMLKLNFHLEIEISYLMRR